MKRQKHHTLHDFTPLALATEAEIDAALDVLTEAEPAVQPVRMLEVGAAIVAALNSFGGAL